MPKNGNHAKPLMRSEIKVLYLTNLEQMLQYTTTDLSTNLTTMKQRLSCPVKMPGFWLVAATASTIQTLRSSSESTGDE
jgi:hypothetical protein